MLIRDHSSSESFTFFSMFISLFASSIHQYVLVSLPYCWRTSESFSALLSIKNELFCGLRAAMLQVEDVRQEDSPKIDSGNSMLPPALFLSMFLFAKVAPLGVLSRKVDFV